MSELVFGFGVVCGMLAATVALYLYEVLMPGGKDTD